MKLLTHNMLECHIKGVTNKYPFKVEVQQLETCESDFNPDFLRRIYPKLDWKALKETAETLKLEGLPESVTEEMLKEDEDFLRTFHHILLEVHVEEGALICPETGRRFPISKDINKILSRTCQFWEHTYTYPDEDYAQCKEVKTLGGVSFKNHLRTIFL